VVAAVGGRLHPPGPGTGPGGSQAALVEDDGVMRPDPDEKPVLPEQSEDETGIGWSEDPEPDDDERLRRERPPHWA
jgi:hypothetical protein